MIHRINEDEDEFNVDDLKEKVRLKNTTELVCKTIPRDAFYPVKKERWNMQSRRKRVFSRKERETEEE